MNGEANRSNGNESEQKPMAAVAVIPHEDDNNNLASTCGDLYSFDELEGGSIFKISAGRKDRNWGIIWKASTFLISTVLLAGFMFFAVRFLDGDSSIYDAARAHPEHHDITEVPLDYEEGTFKSLDMISSQPYPFVSTAILERCDLPTQEGSNTPTLTPLNHSIAFIKTHKTGGSTIVSIFNRILDGRNLQKMIPHDNVRLGWFHQLRPHRDVRGFHQLMDSTTSTLRHQYDAIANHVVYNRTTFDRFLKKPIKYATIVREPLAQAISGFNYFKRFRRFHPSWQEYIEYFQNLKVVQTREDAVHLNSVAYDLGWYHANNMTTSYDRDVERIQAFIDQIDQELDFVMVLEQMAESLVLLKMDVMPSLELSELVWYSQKDSSSEREQTKQERKHIAPPVYPTDEEKDAISELWFVDHMIYDHFSKKLQQRWAEVVEQQKDDADADDIEKSLSSASKQDKASDQLTAEEMKDALTCMSDLVSESVHEDDTSLLSEVSMQKFKLDSAPYTQWLWNKQKLAWPELRDGPWYNNVDAQRKSKKNKRNRMKNRLHNGNKA